MTNKTRYVLFSAVVLVIAMMAGAYFFLQNTQDDENTAPIISNNATKSSDDNKTQLTLDTDIAQLIESGALDPAAGQEGLEVAAGSSGEADTSPTPVETQPSIEDISTRLAQITAATLAVDQRVEEKQQQIEQQRQIEARLAEQAQRAAAKAAQARSRESNSGGVIAHGFKDNSAPEPIPLAAAPRPLTPSEQAAETLLGKLNQLQSNDSTQRSDLDEINTKLDALIASNQANAATKPATNVDQAISQLKTGSVAFNAEQEMEVGKTYEVSLILSLAESPKILKQKLIERSGNSGTTQSNRIRVSERMKASLSGSMFDIELVGSDEIQGISSNEATEWTWTVIPKQPGAYQLYLTLTAILELDGGKEVPRRIETFKKAIEVKVTPAQLILNFVEENWQWLWATLVVPLAGFIWNRVRRRKVYKLDD